MAERIQQLFHIYARGVDVMLPPAQPMITDDLEATRRRIIYNDGTLKERYPTPEDGQEFMQHVCYKRRADLLTLAEEYTPEFIENWAKIFHDKPVAVILFGSVAKGLVKHCNEKDPSNIDISILSDNVSGQEREQYLDLIHPLRDEIHAELMKGLAICSDKIDSPEKNPGNAGVHVQDIQRLSHDFYCGMKTMLLGSCAFPLADPSGLWQRFETAALKDLCKKSPKPDKTVLTKKLRSGKYFSYSPR